MGAQREHSSKPDLFTPSSASEQSAPSANPSSSSPAILGATAATTSRNVLPKDLPAALRRLSDSELALMHASTLDEMKRRGKLAHGVETDLQTLRNRFKIRPTLMKVPSRPTKK